MNAGALHVLTPSYKPAGGVVKLMDYAVHARRFGYDVSVWCPTPVDRASALFSRTAFAALLDDPAVRFHSHRSVTLGPRDLALISLPVHYNLALRMLGPGMSPERIVHLIQGVRNANPTWLGGLATRVLTRPAARISINSIVADTVAPWLDRRSLHRTINLGHDLSFFQLDRKEAAGSPLRVAYTTWKSDVGVRVERALEDDARYEFRAITDHASWPQLRELYHWADVFLSTPGPEEGLYLPGLEAMAAGCLVVTPDVGGNMAYCKPEENCLLVGFDSVRDYTEALHQLATMPATSALAMREAGHAITRAFDLEVEATAFASLLEELWQRIEARESS